MTRWTPWLLAAVAAGSSLSCEPDDPGQESVAVATRAYEAFARGFSTGDFAEFTAMIADEVDFSYPSGEHRGRFTGAEGRARLLAKIEGHVARGERLTMSAPELVAVDGDAVAFEFDSEGQFGDYTYRGHNVLVFTVEGARLRGFREFFGDIDPALFGGRRAQREP